MPAKAVEVPKKGSNSWAVRINHKGKRKLERTGKGEKGKKEAIRIAKMFNKKIKYGNLGLVKPEEKKKKDELFAFKKYAWLWFEKDSKDGNKTSTSDDYKGILKNHILPTFGEKTINEIKRSELIEFLKKKYNENYAYSTVTHMKNVISNIFNYAMVEEIIEYNPIHKLKIKHRTEVKYSTKESKSISKSQILEYDELQLLLDKFKIGQPYHYYLVFTIAYTGMRIGEALALQWQDIDFDNRIIYLERAFVRGRLDDLKNYQRRNVDMSVNLVKILKEFYELQKDKMMDGIESWLFLNSKGAPIRRSDNWRKRIFIPIAEIVEKKIKKETKKSKKIRPHMLRHTFASMLIDQGADAKYVSTQLGHHSVKFTLDIYCHLFDKKKDKEVDKLDNVIKI
ncbi:integrase family protein [Candidatus Magnetomorum sp. HK-1]|nr:integrase family protein [Candidatus Magnetomorum sp. HK-1]